MHIWGLASDRHVSPSGSFNLAWALCLLPGDRHSAVQCLLRVGRSLQPTAGGIFSSVCSMPFPVFNPSMAPISCRISPASAHPAQIHQADLSYSETLVACLGERALHSLEEVKESIGF